MSGFVQSWNREVFWPQSSSQETPVHGSAESHLIVSSQLWRIAASAPDAQSRDVKLITASAQYAIMMPWTRCGLQPSSPQHWQTKIDAVTRTVTFIITLIHANHSVRAARRT